MQRLTNAGVRRALLASIASGKGVRAACQEVGVSRTSLHRYGVRDGGFKQRMREAIAFRGRPADEVKIFLDDVDPPPLAALPPVQPSPVTKPAPVVIDAVVVREEPVPPPPPPPQSGRCKAAFYDRLWDRFENKNTPLVLQVEASRALERHYLREDVLGPPVTATRDRPRGLTREAKRETLHAIIGPNPSAHEDDKDVG